jgi:c-di-GMP-binding flagellar brake protein YcgR
MSSTGHPTSSTTAEVRFDRGGPDFHGHVVTSEPSRIVVAAPLRPTGTDTVPHVGDRAERVWADATALLALPVELSALQHAVLPLWHFHTVGEPATSGQRRAAVRVPVSLPVQLRGAVGHVSGRTLDLSEGGAQCVVDGGDGALTGVGQQLDVTVFLNADHDPLEARATVRRSRLRTDGRTNVAMEFVGLDERDEDRLRGRVFLELRVRRSHGLN